MATSMPAGLFRSVRLVVQPPSTACAPAFALRGGALQTVAPLEGIEFVVSPRQLPAIKQLAVRSEGAAEAPSEEAIAAAQAAAAAAGAGVAAYLAARAALLEALPQGVDVAFEGVESGTPTAVVRPVPAGAAQGRGDGSGPHPAACCCFAQQNIGVGAVCSDVQLLAACQLALRSSLPVVNWA